MAKARLRYLFTNRIEALNSIESLEQYIYSVWGSTLDRFWQKLHRPEILKEILKDQSMLL